MLGSFQHSRDNVQCGVMFNVPGNGLGVTLFNDRAVAIDKGEIVLIGYDPDGSAGLTQGMQALDIATSSFVIYTAVALEAVAVDEIGYFQVSGFCADADVDGTTDVAKGDFLEVLNGADGMIKAGTTRTLGSCAIALEAVVADADTSAEVYLIGEPHTIEAT